MQTNDMLFDLDTMETPLQKDYDVCIVGAGAAGISLALKLVRSRLRVGLIESGSFSLNDATQQLYSGEGGGHVASGYLVSSRLRYFGGTTNHWGGMTRPYQKWDFAPKSWVPESGWPLDINVLAPYYREAEELCEIGSFKILDNLPLSELNALPQPEPKTFETKIFQMSPPTRFGKKYASALKNASNLDIWINSNLTETKLFPNKERVDRISIKSLSGKSLHLRAKKFVLACGALENARMLLNSLEQGEGGLGNSSGYLGQCYMDHNEFVDHAYLFQNMPKKFPMFYRRRSTIPLFSKLSGRPNSVMPTLFVSPQIQEQDQILSYCVELFTPLRNLRPATNIDGATAFLPNKLKAELLRLIFRFEQSPSRNNRVTLINQRDALGLRQINVTANISKLETKTYEHAIQKISQFFGLLEWGRVKFDKSFEGRWCSAHHLGTTRMGTDPTKSVVDTNLKVHSVENLYVAGSSVFPTGSCVNPTLTIVALACRLAGHLTNKVNRRVSSLN